MLNYYTSVNAVITVLCGLWITGGGADYTQHCGDEGLCRDPCHSVVQHLSQATGGKGT